MITDINFPPCEGHPGSHSFNKRLKALEEAISSYQTKFSSPVVESNSITAQSGNITKLTTEEENANSITAKTAKIDYIDNQNGVSYLGEVYAKSLQVEGTNQKADNLTVNEYLTAKNAEVENAVIEEANIGKLTVTGKIDSLNLSKLYIDSNLALEQAQRILKVASEFVGLDIRTQVKPQWMGKNLALENEAANAFTVKGVLNNDTELGGLEPTVEAGDVYFIISHNDSTLGSIPAMAVRVPDTSDPNLSHWEFVNYPGLDAYRTSNDQDVIDNQLSAGVTAVANRVTSVEASLDTLSDTVTLNKQDQDTVNTENTEKFQNIQDNLDNVNDRIDLIETSSIPEAPEDGKLYGRKDGEWAEFETSGDFVNREYKLSEEDIQSIENGENGVIITSSKPMKIPTGDQSDKYVALNREYIKKYLKLSKTGAVGNERAELHFIPSEDTKLKWQQGHLNADTYSYEIYGWAGLYKPVTAGDWEYRFQMNATGSLTGTTVYSYNIVASNGSSVREVIMPVEFYNHITSNTTYSSLFVIDDYCYYYDYDSNKIYALRNGKFIGYCEDADGNTTIPTLSSSRSGNSGFVGLTLKAKSEALLTNPFGNTQIIVGIDENGISGPLKFKSISTGAALSGLQMGVTDNCWWASNAGTNIMKIDSAGNVSSFLLIDPSTDEAITTTHTPGINSWGYLGNGKAITTLGVAGTTYFCIVSEGTTTVTVKKSAIDFTESASLTTKFNYNAFFTSGEYAYFIPTFGCYEGSGSFTPASDSAMKKTAQQQIVKIDLNSLGLTYLSLPFTLRDWQMYKPAVVKTAIGNYIYIFPFAGSGTNVDNFVVIDPDGNMTTVNIGTGSSINWFNNTTASGVNNILQRGKTISNDPVGYASGVAALVAVNGQGVGLMINSELNHAILFNGTDYKTFEISIIRAASQGYSVALKPTKYGWLLSYLGNNTSINQTNTQYKFSYITSKGINQIFILGEYDNYDIKQTEFETEGACQSFHIMRNYTAIQGNRTYSESVGGTNSIFLNDGDTVISEVEL